jgi:hypothetical protein
MGKSAFVRNAKDGAAVDYIYAASRATRGCLASLANSLCAPGIHRRPCVIRHASN